MKDNTPRAPLRKGDLIPASRIQADRATMACYDFGASYAVAGVLIDGNHAGDGEGYDSRIEYSLNGKDWTALTGEGSGGEQARYVRMTGEAASFADERIAFVCDTGFAVEPADEWTNLFHRHSGWAGSDGIYSIPFNGVETQGTAGDTKTLLVFGDTFVGEVDEQTRERSESTVMLNNTLAVLDGAEPRRDAVRFVWREDGNGEPLSAIVPTTPKALSRRDTYYWLQDGTSCSGTFHCFPLIIGHDPNGPEGFEFAVHGVTHVSAPLTADGPDLARQRQEDTPLYFKSSKGHTTYFGAAIMPNTNEAGAPNPDGYVYVYGLQHDGVHRPVVARAPEAELANIGQWTYWNGSGWTSRKEECAPIAPEVSCEYSVSPMRGGALDGKYVVACQLGGTSGNHLALYDGSSPVGPFERCTRLYYCPESEEGLGIYTYNAKGHPHLSPTGELLVTYNVNTTSMEANMARGDIYRPRFVRVRQIP